VNSLLEKVRRILGRSLHASPENMIWTLNPIIRGCGNYHRHMMSKKIFADIDNTICHALWRWARRRHLNKTLPMDYQSVFHIRQ
jgi:RNA-directed DNA polymerase